MNSMETARDKPVAMSYTPIPLPERNVLIPKRSIKWPDEILLFKFYSVFIVLNAFLVSLAGSSKVIDPG